MDLISILFLVFGGLLAIGSLYSLIMALSKKWNSAYNISRATTLGTVCLYVTMIVYVILNVVVSTTEPSSRAAALGRGISLVMNISLYLFPAVIMSGIVWPISGRRKTKRSKETENG